MTLTIQQDQAIKLVAEWFRDPHSAHVFYLGGYAGTGKTFLARMFAEGIDGKVLFGAFTGKAALVMERKGCVGAQTIHSMIYRIISRPGRPPRFVIDRDSVAKDAALIIIDECSMVDEDLGRDLLSFGIKVLVLGDPAQLPPVGGAGFFTAHDPNFMMTDIRRQALDNPIIKMSMIVREGGELEVGTYGDSRVITRKDVRPEAILASDAVLIGLNKTRRLYNRRIRELKKLPPHVVAGDRLVCLKNKREAGLLNGGLWDVSAVVKRGADAIHLEVDPFDAGSARRIAAVKVHPFFFEDREAELSWQDLRGYDQFTYGNALTVHKFQGSQADRVTLFDESHSFRDFRKEHLYTGITRAAETIDVVVPS